MSWCSKRWATRCRPPRRGTCAAAAAGPSARQAADANGRHAQEAGGHRSARGGHVGRRPSDTGPPGWPLAGRCRGRHASQANAVEPGTADRAGGFGRPQATAGIAFATPRFRAGPHGRLAQGCFRRLERHARTALRCRASRSRRRSPPPKIAAASSSVCSVSWRSSPRKARTWAASSSGCKHSPGDSSRASLHERRCRAAQAGGGDAAGAQEQAADAHRRLEEAQQQLAQAVAQAEQELLSEQLARILEQLIAGLSTTEKRRGRGSRARCRRDAAAGGPAQSGFRKVAGRGDRAAQAPACGDRNVHLCTGRGGRPDAQRGRPGPARRRWAGSTSVATKALTRLNQILEALRPDEPAAAADQGTGQQQPRPAQPQGNPYKRSNRRAQVAEIAASNN